MVRYEVRRARGAQSFYCRAVWTGNGQVLMTSETYVAKADAVHVANLLRGSNNAPIFDLT
jgi:uncharacterized protein YegP (UPF0339 family)